MPVKKRCRSANEPISRYQKSANTSHPRTTLIRAPHDLPRTTDAQIPKAIMTPVAATGYRQISPMPTYSRVPYRNAENGETVSNAATVNERRGSRPIRDLTIPDQSCFCNLCPPTFPIPPPITPRSKANPSKVSFAFAGSLIFPVH